MYRGEHKECVAAVKDFLAAPDAGWNTERSAACLHAASALRKLKDDAEAETWLLRAAFEERAAREPWVELAQLYWDQGRWAAGYGAAVNALAVGVRGTSHHVSADAWAGRPHDLASLCAWWLGMKDKAAGHFVKALEFNPADPRLLENAKFMLPAAAAKG
jgi:tetratricopeptide (TPR) repeat protein